MNNTFLEQPRRGKTREAQITPHKAKPQCGAREAQITPYKRSAVWGHLLLLIAALVFAACGNRHVSVKISGDIQDGGNRKVHLALITADGLEMIDSANLENGHFEFKVSSENELVKERENAPMMFQLFLSDNNSLATMAKKGEKLVITADAQDLTKTYRISGGEEAVLMHQLDSALTVFVTEANKLYEIYQQNVENDSVRGEIETKYMNLLSHHREYLEKFIAGHPDNMASYIAFFQSYNRRNFFDVYQDLDLLKKINANMSKIYPESEYVKTMIHVAEMVDNRQSDEQSMAK